MKKIICSVLLLSALAIPILGADNFEWDLISKVPAGITSCIIKDFEGLNAGRAWYDDEGHLIKAETVPGGKTGFSLFMTKRYSRGGDMLEKVVYGTENPEYKEMVNYRNGRIRNRQIYSWNNDEFVVTRDVQVTYDGMGNIVMIVRRDMSGRIISREEYNYDEQDMLKDSKIEMPFENGEDKILIIRVYNEHGHIIQEEFHNLAQGWSFMTIYKYEYNSQGLPVKIALYENEDQETPHWGYVLEYN